MRTLPASSSCVKSSQQFPTKTRDKQQQVSFDFDAPRSCNTGAQFSLGKNYAKVDWLEFTVKDVLPFHAVSEYLRLSINDFELAEYGMQGYTDCYLYGFVKVLHSPDKPDRGTKIILSASALDEVARDSFDIMRLVLRDGGTFARIDLALDDRTESLSVDMFWQAEQDGFSVCHFKQVEQRNPWNRHTKSLAGHGVNYGSRSSSRYIRIYDKELEQKNTQGIDTGHWVRVELQANKRAAMNVVVALLQNGIESIPAIIAGALDFRQRAENGNSSRCDRLPWWSDFLGQVSIIKTGIKKAVKTVEDKLTWLSRQCKKAMGQVAHAFGSDVIVEMVEQGIRQTTQKEWSILFPEENDFPRTSHYWSEINPCPF